MVESKPKKHKKSRHRPIEPLISTQREDGLWQSIERDGEDLASHFDRHLLVPSNGTVLAANKEDVSDQDMMHHHLRDSTMSKAEPSDAPSPPDIHSVKEDTKEKRQSPSTSSRADLLTLAWVSISPPQQPGHPPPSHHVPEILRDEPPSHDQPQAATRRRRGGPRKSQNAPNWSRPRRVRFSDPIPPDSGPGPECRDTHVFVRLLKIIVCTGSPHPPQRQELVWNNRAKGWRLAGERSERNIGDVADLFDDLARHGSLLKTILAPTVQRGARESVELVWNAASCCFQGVSQDVGSLSVALGEMKDMVKDPWARQFVGYVMLN